MLREEFCIFSTLWQNNCVIMVFLGGVARRGEKELKRPKKVRLVKKLTSLSAFESAKYMIAGLTSIFRWLVGVEPVAGDAAGGGEGDVVVIGVFHVANHDFLNLRQLCGHNFEIQFVVYLHNHF